MDSIKEVTLYQFNGVNFETLELARQYRRKLAAQDKLFDLLDESDIYWKDTSASEVANMLLAKWDEIKAIVEGDE
jgi:hypothetical protein